MNAFQNMHFHPDEYYDSLSKIQAKMYAKWQAKQKLKEEKEFFIKIKEAKYD